MLQESINLFNRVQNSINCSGDAIPPRASFIEELHKFIGQKPLSYSISHSSKNVQKTYELNGLDVKIWEPHPHPWLRQ